MTTTVNQIVSNLQNVETPWKTQLTALQSKDTALSSLGTQISTLSTDLQNLTDFSGTMAYKTGSSSDTNVLTLSSAARRQWPAHIRSSSRTWPRHRARL